MANTCITDYIIEAPKPTLDRLEQAIRNPKIDPGSDKRWEGNVILTLGGKINPDYYLRGFISDIHRNPADAKYPERLVILAEEAWHKTQFAEALKEILPDVKIYWYEDVDDGKSTNDREQKYYETGYLLDAYNDETEKEFYDTYPTKEELMKVVSDEFGVTDEDEIDYYEGNGDGHLNVYEIDIVDDGLNKVNDLQESVFESYSKKYNDSLKKLGEIYKQLTIIANILSKEEAKLDKELDKPGKDQKERKLLSKLLDSIKDGKKHILRSSECINDACELIDGGIEID